MVQSTPHVNVHLWRTAFRVSGKLLVTSSAMSLLEAFHLLLHPPSPSPAYGLLAFKASWERSCMLAHTVSPDNSLSIWIFIIWRLEGLSHSQEWLSNSYVQKTIIRYVHRCPNSDSSFFPRIAGTVTLQHPSCDHAEKGKTVSQNQHQHTSAFRFLAVWENSPVFKRIYE